MITDADLAAIRGRNRHAHTRFDDRNLTRAEKDRSALLAEVDELRARLADLGDAPMAADPEADHG
jgi:hypothetical protein